ncbi:MAG: FUSC family membrane protein [Sediminicola sp.]
MLKDHVKSALLFFKSSHFYRGVHLTVSLLIPLIVLESAGHFEFAVSIALGVFLNAPGNVPGSFRRKIYGTLISIALVMVVTLIICFAKSNPFFLLLSILCLAFSVAMISAYGPRGSLIAFSGLLAIALGLARDVSGQAIWLHVGLIGVGGLWFLFMLWIFHTLSPKKEEDQLLSETLDLTGRYLTLRGQLLTKKTKREKLSEEIFQLQAQLTEKHETLRELLLSERRKLGRSHFDEKRVLIFISLVDILELALSNMLDYHKIDQIFGQHQHHLKSFTNLNMTMGRHLQELAQILLERKSVQSKEELLRAVDEAKKSLEAYKMEVPLPDGRKGALTLRNLLDYQEQQIAKVRAIRRLMNNVHEAGKLALQGKQAQQFITSQDYGLHVLIQHLSLRSPIFRHALRLTITVGIGFLLATYAGIKNPYWIVLTLIVLMRPSYGLTKERATHRIIGTLIGATFATIVILLTKNTIVYEILAVISLTMAFSLITYNYRAAATFITINIIFVYALMDPNSFQVIQYRVLDTSIGAVLAVLANYILWPSWEYMNLNSVIVSTVRQNSSYLMAISELYNTKTGSDLDYKIPRKEAFLAIGNLNAAFQRMTQDPKSKQRELAIIYEIVTLNNAFLSALASLGSFIRTHKTTAASVHFKAYIQYISKNLQLSAQHLEGAVDMSGGNMAHIEETKKNLESSYEMLVMERTREIGEGKVAIAPEMRLQLQEALLVSNQLVWLGTLSQDMLKAVKKYRPF